jgi:hypothetical protein
VKPAVSLPDAERAVIDILTSAGQTGVSTDFPDVKLISPATKVQVDLENSGVGDYPVAERAQVRVTCHAAPGRRTSVKQLAGEVLMDLYTYGGDAAVAGIVPLGGRSAVTVDPDTQNVMCWVLVRVDLKASLAS